MQSKNIQSTDIRQQLGIYRVGHEDVTYFTLQLWTNGWSGETKCCMHTYILVCS